MSEEIALDAVGQRYRLKGELGRGGMSVVYEGLDPRIGRQVAIKLLHPHLAAREDARKRFLQEAKAIARLENPNILKVYDYDSPNGSASYIVSEFIDGITFKAWCEQHKIEHWEVVALLAIPLFQALEHAHQQQVIHRDVKPENMMIRQRDGSPVLMDFGIAHMVDSETLTATGAVIGSPAHMAPEVVNGEVLTNKADLFSMGTVLYWMCCGALPFVAPNPAALFRRILEARFDPIRDRCPEILSSFARIIEQCMAREPCDRPSSAQYISESLRSLLGLVGINDIEKSLAELSASPEKFQQNLSEQLVSNYCQSAQEKLKQGDLGLSLELVEHVLVKFPNQADALKLEREIRKSLKKQTSILVYKYGIVAIIFSVIFLLLNPVFSPQKNESLAGGTLQGSVIQSQNQTNQKSSKELMVSKQAQMGLRDKNSGEKSAEQKTPFTQAEVLKKTNSDQSSSQVSQVSQVAGSSDQKSLKASPQISSRGKTTKGLVKQDNRIKKSRVGRKRIKKLTRKYKSNRKQLGQRSLKVIPKAKQRVDISSIYKGVNVKVNGKNIGHIYEIDRVGGLDLAIGEKHSILFSSPFCETHREVIMFKRKQSRVPRLIFECRFKNAKFNIKSTQAVEVFLNGNQPRKLGTSNQVISFPMQATQSTLSLLLMTSDQQTKSLKIKVAAGQYKELNWPK